MDNTYTAIIIFIFNNLNYYFHPLKILVITNTCISTSVMYVFVYTNNCVSASVMYVLYILAIVVALNSCTSSLILQ